MSILLPELDNLLYALQTHIFISLCIVSNMNEMDGSQNGPAPSLVAGALNN